MRVPAIDTIAVGRHVGIPKRALALLGGQHVGEVVLPREDGAVVGREHAVRVEAADLLLPGHALEAGAVEDEDLRPAREGVSYVAGVHCLRPDEGGKCCWEEVLVHHGCGGELVLCGERVLRVVDDLKTTSGHVKTAVGRCLNNKNESP